MKKYKLFKKFKKKVKHQIKNNYKSTQKAFLILEIAVCQFEKFQGL